MSKTEKFIVLVLGVLCLSFLGYIVRAPESHGTPVAAGPRAQTVTLTDFNWIKDGFGSIMMLSFTVRNDNDFAVKDITVKCKHSGLSGTQIDQNSRTVYEVISARSSRYWQKFNMGFIHSQVSKTDCKVINYAKVQ